MKLSVVTVCYNSEETIRDTIESFLTQSYPHKELIIVDGLSTDKTMKLVSAFTAPDIRVISEPDAGVFDAMNKGLRIFDGDGVGFLNSDDTFHDTHALAAIASALAVADVAYGDLLMVTDHATKQVVREWRAGVYKPGAFELGWQPPHPGFFVRRETIERVGFFDTRYISASDYDYMLRVFGLRDLRHAYVDKVIVDFKMGGISTRDWKATLRGSVESLRSRQEHLHGLPIDAALFLRLFRRIVQMRDVRRYYSQD